MLGTITSSSNDMSSTMDTSLTSITMNCTLTADTIIKECIRQGFYRNPVCNEVLYLHHKGFDSIDPNAFELYTDVKVLWLEGNGLTFLPCGESWIQVRPPKHRSLLDSASDNDASDAEEKPVEDEAALHADPMNMDGSMAGKKKEAKAKRFPALPLPDCKSIEPNMKDAFSSLYPTVTQLYLHNNVFREMPDLNRFQRLNSCNLSNNFFSVIQPRCPQWDVQMAEFCAREGPFFTENADEVDESCVDAVVVIPCEESRAARDSELKEYTRLVELFSSFCTHEALHPDTCGLRWEVIPPIQRCPCSSLRTLNLAGNHIETFLDVAGLLCFKALAVLDLSGNRIKDGEMLLMVLEKLPCLSSLKLTGNPMIRSLRQYRKTVLSRCTALLHLDDRPVFEEERRMVAAWTAGGVAGEDRERKLMREEKEAKEKKRLDDFRRLIARAERGSPHGDLIGAISTKEALAAVTADESSSTSSETESDSES